MEFALQFTESSILSEMSTITSFTPVRWPLAFTDVIDSLIETVSCSSFTPVRWAIAVSDTLGTLIETLTRIAGIRVVSLQSFLVQPVQRMWAIAAGLLAKQTWSIAPVTRSFVAGNNMPLIYATEKRDVEVVDFTFDWTTAIGADTIAGSVWTLPAGVTAVSQTYTPTSATVRLSGGQGNYNYELTNAITTASGLVMTQDLFVPVVA